MNLEQAIEDIQRLRENDSLSSKIERQAIENILKSFARTIVEQSVGEEKKFNRYEDNHKAERLFDEYLVDNEEEGRSIPYRYLNAAMVDAQMDFRSQTLSNADNLLK